MVLEDPFYAPSFFGTHPNDGFCIQLCQLTDQLTGLAFSEYYCKADLSMLVIPGCVSSSVVLLCLKLRLTLTWSLRHGDYTIYTVECQVVISNIIAVCPGFELRALASQAVHCSNIESYVFLMAIFPCGSCILCL